jgi:hypothetical protein
MRRRITLICGAIIGAALISLALMSQAPGHAQDGNASTMWVPTWEVSYGGYRKLTDLASVDTVEAWGIDGNIVSSPTGPRDQTLYVHRTGDLWRVAQVQNGTQMLAIDVTRSGAGFAVGEHGAIQHYSGWRWQPATSPTRHRLADVAIVSADEGWAVGDRGTILEWDGKSWDAVDVPAEIRVFLISAVASPVSGEAWATSTGGQILRYEGDDWFVFTAPSLDRPTGIAFDTVDRGMAVGRNVLEFSNGRWSEIESPASVLTSVAWHAGVAYAAGDGQLWQYVDGTWAPVTGPDVAAGFPAIDFGRVARAADGVWGLSRDTAATVHMSGGPANYVLPALRSTLAIDMITTTFGWAGGPAITAGLVGAVDGPWTAETAMSPGSEVQGIDLVSRSDGWAVGRMAGTTPEARMWRWVGSQWDEWPVEKTWELSNVDMISADDGWANGGNLIARWDGQEWRQQVDVAPAGTPGGLSMLEGGDNPEGWFGGYGLVIHLVDGEWQQDRLPDTRLVFDIEVPGRSEGWATTGTKLYRYDGETWSEAEIELAPGSLIMDIDAPDVGNAWVLVENQGLYHWNGSDWARHDLSPLGVGFKPMRISALRIEQDSLATEVWLAGEEPSIGLYRVVTPVGTIHLPLILRGSALRP